MIELRKSLLTGMRHVDSNGVAGWPRVSVMLYDGAQAVPVHGKWSPEARVLTPSSYHTLRETHVCCGPAAPLPARDENLLDAWEQAAARWQTVRSREQERGER